MASENYFLWLTNETPTTWWHDSGDPAELRLGLANGATGVTTNPVLTYRALRPIPISLGIESRPCQATWTPSGGPKS